MIAWLTQEKNILIKGEKKEVLSAEFAKYVPSSYDYIFYYFTSEGKLLKIYQPLMSSEKEILSFSGYAIENSALCSLYAEINYDAKKDGIKLSKKEESIKLVELHVSRISFANRVKNIIAEYHNNCKKINVKKIQQEQEDIHQLLVFLSGKENIQLIWDAEGSEGSEVWSVIKNKEDGKVIWKARAYYGESKRAEEIETFLKSKLGNAFKCFEINHSNDLCSLYYYGD